MHHPIERALPPGGVRSAENINEVFVGHEQRSLLDGPVECRTFDREEFYFRREVVPCGLLSGPGRLVVDEEGAVGDSFGRPVEPSRFILDDVDIRVEKAAFPVLDQTEIVIVPMPHRRPQAQDCSKTTGAPVAR